MAGQSAVAALRARGGDRPGRTARLFEVVLEPYYYLGPALILIALVMVLPLLVGLSYAFRDIRILAPFSAGFVGLDHFETLLFRDRVFWRSLGNTLWWTAGSLVFQFLLGLGLALLLNRPFGGRSWSRP
jgi:multiple sugar transport system permease protein